jgi:biopolymer transport protein ExbD
MIRRKRPRRRQTASLTDISMTPLIDTALTLLVIFMMATPVIQNAVRITLPNGESKEDGGAQQELVVFLDKNNQLYLNKDKIEKKNLIAEIKKQVGNKTEKTVFVKADRGVNYGTVIELVDEIKIIGGVKYVALATQKRTQTA